MANATRAWRRRDERKSVLICAPRPEAEPKEEGRKIGKEKESNIATNDDRDSVSEQTQQMNTCLFAIRVEPTLCRNISFHFKSPKPKRQKSLCRGRNKKDGLRRIG